MLGIDVGTSGVRAILAGIHGQVVAVAEMPIDCHREVPRMHEQEPRQWWEVLCACTREVMAQLSGRERMVLSGVSVCSTSGTLVVVDSEGNPLHRAILYDDTRSAAAAAELNRCSQADFRWDASHTLAKAVWLRTEFPHIWDQARHLLHPADWLTGKLCGSFGISDFSNSLKLGYQQQSGKWHTAVDYAGIPLEMLPVVVTPGDPVGLVSEDASLASGLPPGVPVIAGTTDGMASLLASGAMKNGDVNTTLGTTLVWKALISARRCAPPSVYWHRHPSGDWAPGAASNTGLGSVQPGDPNRRLRDLPATTIGYPLRGVGERFPFMYPQATAFWESTPVSPDEAYAAELQAIAFIERWGYDVLAGCGIGGGSTVFSAGRGARNSELSHLRASVMDRDVVCCRHPDAAFGAAILASRDTCFGGDVAEAMQSMVQTAEVFEPGPLRTAYGELYLKFREACARRGYIG